MPHKAPETKIETLNFMDILKFQKKIFLAIIKRVIYRIKILLSSDLKKKFQVIFKLKREVNSKEIK
tara:strand:- start:2645 stop:2842 length:198 start_codon:yes stop_codon:yes gene_type:complete